MNGQNDGYRPRTAGERNGMPDSGNTGVRDWQKNTWFGPAPQNNNPFDEPEDAPELKATRSDHVNQHMGDFWKPPEQQQQQQTWPGWTDTRAQAGNGVRPAVKSKKARPKALPVIIGLVLVLAAALVVLRFTVFSIREIQVIGNRNLSAAEIIRVSGIRRGDSIFAVSEEKVRERIQADYRLKFSYLARKMPNTVVLSVREREPCCWLVYCGIMYVLDKDRMVLYESENPADKPIDLVEVKGLQIRSNTVVGQCINLGSEIQKSVFTEMFREMKALGCINSIAEADISDTNSILLVTREGFIVGMGDRTNIHAKLRSMLLVRDELIRMGENDGIINVNNPESPIFQRSSSQ